MTLKWWAWGQVITLTTFHECFIFHPVAWLSVHLSLSAGWNPVMEPHRVISLIVALLFVIIAIRKAQRLRFLALYFLYKRRLRHITHALLATKIKRLQHRQRKASARRRRVVWSYPILDHLKSRIYCGLTSNESENGLTTVTSLLYCLARKKEKNRLAALKIHV